MVIEEAVNDVNEEFENYAHAEKLVLQAGDVTSNDTKESENK